MIKRKKKHSKKKYEKAVWVQGIRVASRTFETVGEGEVWAKRTKEQYLAGIKADSSTLTLKSVVALYVKEALPSLRLSTQEARSTRLKYLTEAPIGGMTLDRIDPRAIEEWLRWLKINCLNSTRRRSSFREEVRTIRTILSWYRDSYDYRYQPPVLKKHAKMADLPNRVVRRPDHFIPPGDVALWLTQLNQRPDPVYYALGLTMVLLGLRMGEATGLCWDCVSMVGKGRSTIAIRRTMSWRHSNKEPYLVENVKSSSSARVLSIPKEVEEIILPLKGRTNPNNLVFVNFRGQPLRDNTIRLNFNEAFRKAGLPWNGTHILRHTFGTIGLQAQGDVSRVQAVLGHSSPTQTTAYAKVISLQKSPISAMVADMIFHPNNSPDGESNRGENRGECGSLGGIK